MAGLYVLIAVFELLSVLQIGLFGIGNMVAALPPVAICLAPLFMPFDKILMLAFNPAVLGGLAFAHLIFAMTAAVQTALKPVKSKVILHKKKD
jgi:hypothetical protein